MARLCCHRILHQLICDFAAEMLRNYEIAFRSHTVIEIFQQLAAPLCTNVGKNLEGLFVILKGSGFGGECLGVLFVPQ